MSDQRNYFRINHDVILDYRHVDAYTAENSVAADQFDEPLPLRMLAQFHELDTQVSQLARSVGESQRNLVDLCLTLNKKINLLSREILTHTAEMDHPTARVNLSEGGIAFVADKPIYKGSYIALRLVFLPSYTAVVLFAKVTRSKEVKSDTHHIAANFHRASAAERQVIARQIMEIQRRAKQQQRSAGANVAAPSDYKS